MSNAWLFLGAILLAASLAMWPFTFVITLLAPTRHLVAWLTMLTLIFVQMPSQDCNRLSGFDSVLVGTGWLAFAPVILLKTLFIKSAARQPMPAPSNIPMIATAALAALSLLSIFDWGISEFRPPWLSQPTAVLAAVGLWLLAPWCASVRHAPRPVRSFMLAFRGSTAVIGVCVAVWFWTSIGTVASRAEIAAGGAPYCIQVVANDNRYHAVTAQLELSSMSMRARCIGIGCQRIYPALVRDEDGRLTWLTWSARRQEFVRETHDQASPPLTVQCRPRPHFALGLPPL